MGLRDCRNIPHVCAGDLVVMGVTTILGVFYLSGGRQSPVELNHSEFRRHGGLTPPRSEGNLQEWLLHPW